MECLVLGAKKVARQQSATRFSDQVKCDYKINVTRNTSSSVKERFVGRSSRLNAMLSPQFYARVRV